MQAAIDMEFLQQVIVAIRNIRAELGIAPGAQLTVLLRADGQERDLLLDHAIEISTLARVGTLRVEPDMDIPKGCASAVIKGCELFIPLEGVVDFEAELARMDKELGKLAKELEVVTKKLANESFTNKAPAEIVAKEQAKAQEFSDKKQNLEQLKAKLLAFLG
jgi:valyl-tRNA synthetase